MTTKKSSVWITWEIQRRSIELAKALDCDYYQLDYNGFLRYPKCVIKTVGIISNRKYDVIFVQNPSMVLAAVACILKILLSKIIIVDRHSTFRFTRPDRLSLNYLLYKILNRFTIKSADLTIVTNKHLADIVEKMGGRAFVLPDKLPNFPRVMARHLEGEFNVLFICSYAKDEPILQAFEAMRQISNSRVNLYVTGNYKKLDRRIISRAPKSVKFTGYLNEHDYIEMLYSVDAVMVLTTTDFTMLCGCYEAVSVCKPIITSRKSELMTYFRGSIFVENDIDAIASGLLEMSSNYHKYYEASLNLKPFITQQWDQRFQAFLAEVSTLSP